MFTKEGLAAVLLFITGASAQVDRSELSGAVLDPAGATIAHVELTLANQETNASRITHTDDRGRYVFSQLAPGQYSLTAHVEGFETETRRDIVLTVGRSAVLDLTMRVAGISSEAVVTAAAQLIETRSTALSSTMDTASIRNLPLNGRDFAQLALLQPGVAPSRRTSDSGGPGTKLAIGGNRPGQVSFRLDGSDINDSNNNTPGSAAGVLLGVDTLQEFRVLTNSYSAAYGRNAGGVVSAITRSGGNDFHGSIFEFLRNSALDAKNFFDPVSAPIPRFQRNQFGAEFEGPVIGNRLFFLLSYEGLRQRLGVTSRSVVPDSQARMGLVAGRTVPVSSSVMPYLALIPLPNERGFGDGTGEYVSTASQATDENFVTGRVDYRKSDFTSFFLRFTLDNGTVTVPDGFKLVRADTTSRNRYVTAEGTHIFSERLLDTVRVSDNRSSSKNANTFLSSVDPSLSFIPGQPLGQTSVTGLFSLGPNRFGPQFSRINLWQFSDDLAYTRGRNSLNVGFDYRFYNLPVSRPQSPYGFYQFNSLADFLQARPFAVELTVPRSQLERDWRQAMTAAYVQDDIQITRRFTINAGLRYERVTVPTEAHGLMANLRDPLHDSQPAIGPLFQNPSNLDFAPRAGFAWDPFGSGKTSIRSGFGLFYDPVWTDFYTNAGNREPPFYTLGSVRSPVFPHAVDALAPAAFIPGRQDVLQYRPRNPYTMQYNFTVQRQVGASAVLSIGYAGQRGLHLVRFLDENQAIPQILPDGRKYFPANSAPRNPNFTGIRYKTTDGQSFYNAFQISFEQRVWHGFSLHANYVFSRNIDDGSVTVTQGGDNDLPQDPDSRKAERGLSNYDVRHYFTMYSTWNLPRLHSLGLLGRGWQWNVVTALASGNPFSVVVGFDRARARFQAGSSPQRPDLVPGRSNNPVVGGPDRYFDASAFALPEPGFYGNLGRNTLIGPGLASTDTSLNRTFWLRERISLQFRAEFFNVFNRPNFAIPSQRTVFSSTGRVGSAGRITSTLSSSRQIQFGLKLSF